VADTDGAAVRVHGSARGRRPGRRRLVPVRRQHGVRARRHDVHGQYHPEEEVFAQWYGRGGIEPVLGSSWDGRLTFMGPRTTSLGGGWAGFGSYAQGC